MAISMNDIARAVTAPARTLAELAELAQRLAARPQDWVERVRLRSDEPWFERIEQGPDHDVWLISWLPGQTTGFHDHGESSGAFAVALGALEEHRADTGPLTVGFGEVRTFGPRYTHDVRNLSTAPAISIHVYSPPWTEMNKYELAGDDLVALAPDQEVRPREPGGTAVRLEVVGERTLRRPSAPRSIEAILCDARARLLRLLPAEAHEALNSGAVLVDIRPEAQRAAEGEIPGALIVERNVLEWRFDPASDARLPEASGYDLQVILLCSEGYTSSLAAAALQDLGLTRATDVIGGFRAWRAAGLLTFRSS